MYRKGIALNFILLGIGIAAIVGIFAINAIIGTNALERPVTDAPEVEEPDAISDNTSVPPNDDIGAPSQTAPQIPSTPLSPPPAPPTVPSESPDETTVEPPAPAPTPAPAPAPTPAPEPAPQPPATTYSPGFKATSRVTPEIPSENERATLPSCEGKLFPLEPVEFSKVVSVSPTGTFGASTNPPSFTVFDFGTSGEFEIVNIVAPADVYVTNIVQEHNITADSEDTTIYFALCRDVIGYVTNVKELSAAMQELVTDTNCFGKPQTGENACKIEVLELIGQGSFLGEGGKYGGKMGFGVIDLRKNRNLANPSAYPIKTNFAACPLEYLANSSGFYGKLSSENNLCTKP